MSYRFIPSFFLYRNWVYGQVTRKSSYPKLCRQNFWVKSPEMMGYVVWNFIMLKNILTSLQRFFRLNNFKERDILLICRASLIPSSLKERDVVYTLY